MSEISVDALLLWSGFFQQRTLILAFGGKDAVRIITPRARTALDELIEAGHCVKIDTDDDREAYRGTDKSVAIPEGFNPFDTGDDWAIFERKR